MLGGVRLSLTADTAERRFSELRQEGANRGWYFDSLRRRGHAPVGA